MPLVSPNLPADTDTLCEKCGYRLNSLPPDGNCPECGQPIAHSTQNTGRSLPRWETAPRLSLTAFSATCYAIIAHPITFFRTLVTRHSPARSHAFATLARAAAALLMAVATALHLSWLVAPTLYPPAVVGLLNEPSLIVLHIIALWPLVWAALTATSWLATRLTAFESKYHGLRLPQPVVQRLMNYHTACYLPVSLTAALYIAAARTLIATGILGPSFILNYLYLLCAFVIFSAAYLFWTYWMAMKNAMYANV
jgi:hypothetical protein